MNQDQVKRMSNDPGFIAALDQSGGSTPKALKAYGVLEDAYSNDKQMFDQVHQMRTRIIKSPAFDKKHILGAILFENTMDRQIDNMDTADFLWEEKGIIPFLKIDKGLADQQDGVQMMKDMPDLEQLLNRANDKHIFGTKMRSVIHEANPLGIRKVVKQQFEIAQRVLDAGLVPIIEPEVDIHSPRKFDAEQILRDELLSHLDDISEDDKVIFKLTLPEEDNFYQDLINHPKVMRVVALSGGYTREDSNEKLSRNHGMIASFSRALSEGLLFDQSEEDFDQLLGESIQSIADASNT